MAPTSTSYKSYFTYISLRVLALVGVLLFIDTLLKSHWPRSSSNNPSHDTNSQHNTIDHAHETTKAIIAPMLVGEEQNHAWMHEMFPDWQHHIFSVNDPAAPLHVTKNKGREASVYLTYIINHYYSLPDFMVFVHGRRYEWHTDDPMYDTAHSLQTLNFDHVAEVGYASLRCHWSPGCPVEVHPDLEINYDGIFGIDHEYAVVYNDFFPNATLPEKVGAPCCAQFVVSRDAVLLRPVAEYEKYRQWLWDTPLPGGRTGRIMEYMWHIIFGMDAVLCLDAEECYCRKFGVCGLDCSREECKGRYWEGGLNSPFPTDWPEEGQGERGWPVDGWWEKNGKEQQDREEKVDAKRKEDRNGEEGRRRRIRGLNLRSHD